MILIFAPFLFFLPITKTFKQTENEQLSTTLKNIEREHAEQQEKAAKELEEIKASYVQQIDKINRQHDKTRRELESIVMKYAMSEKQILDAQKLKNDFEKKMKDALKDKDALMVRIKGLSNEKQSLMSALDGKVNEITAGQKEVDKVKKQLKEKEAQLMQFEFKLNKEIENQAETSKKLESSLKTVEELGKELSVYRETGDDAEEMTSINKSELDGKCKEIVELRARNSELEEQCQQQQKRIKQLEMENGKFEEDQKRLSGAIGELRQEFVVCNEKIEAGKRLKIDYDEKVEQLERTEQELESLRKENDELVTESKAYRQKEGELLEFTDRLQTKTIELQSEHNHYKARCGELESKFGELQDTINRQTAELSELRAGLATAKEQHENELSIFARKLAEESNAKEKLKREKEELENENKIIKKKQVTSIKELNKELIVLRRKVEQSEQSNSSNADQNGAPQANQETISLGSRTDSSNSLTHNSLDRTPNGEQIVLPDNGDLMRAPLPPQNAQILNPNFASSADIAQQLDKSVLLNKILALQQQLAKLRSRVEFLEEHNQTLLEDIKKKSKLIQNFILREEAGALSSNDLDAFKVGCRFELCPLFTNLIPICLFSLTILLTIFLTIF